MNTANEFLDGVEGVHKSVDSVDICGQRGQCGHLWTACGQDVDSVWTVDERNLSQEIREFVNNCNGSFTTTDIDRELDLGTGAHARKNKKNRTEILRRLVKEGKIEKDENKALLYHKVNLDIEWCDRSKVEGKKVDVRLPLGLSDLVAFHPKSMIVVAGASNAGKTALLLHIAKDNADLHKTIYLYSEMGDDEFVARTRSFIGVPEQQWEKVRAAFRREDQAAVIKKHNPDGLTIVDFVEEKDGEYFKMSHKIRKLYDALGDGIVVASIQKATGTSFGRGGEATLEKPRLYMALDIIHKSDQRIFCALKIVKAKSYIGNNCDGKTCIFSITNGWKIEQVYEWAFMNDRELKDAVALLEKQHGRKEFLKKCVTVSAPYASEDY